MILTAKVKLHPTPEQAKSLLATIERTNQAANYVSGIAFSTSCFHRFAIHTNTYQEVRQSFGLSAQATVMVIAKVAEAYALGKSLRKFRPRGSALYDSRILAWKEGQTVSIWTLDGRLRIPWTAGPTDTERLNAKRTQAKLAHINGEFYLFQAVEVPDVEPTEPNGFLGVDMGLVQIATDSDGNQYSGGAIRGVRRRRRRQRGRLQSKQTRSAKRRLKRLSGRERRYATDLNHQISKKLVALAKGTGRGISIEDLEGIRARVTVQRKQRADLHSWAFHQLQTFIVYKAKIAGVAVKVIDPRNTSRTCAECGHCEKANRKSQDRFVCLSCGHAANADFNAARNISGWASTERPYATA